MHCLLTCKLLIFIKICKFLDLPSDTKYLGKSIAETLLKICYPCFFTQYHNTCYCCATAADGTETLCHMRSPAHQTARTGTAKNDLRHQQTKDEVLSESHGITILTLCHKCSVHLSKQQSFRFYTRGWFISKFHSLKGIAWIRERVSLPSSLPIRTYALSNFHSITKTISTAIIWNENIEHLRVIYCRIIFACSLQPSRFMYVYLTSQKTFHRLRGCW